MDSKNLLACIQDASRRVVEAVDRLSNQIALQNAQNSSQTREALDRFSVQISAHSARNSSQLQQILDCLLKQINRGKERKTGPEQSELTPQASPGLVETLDREPRKKTRATRKLSARGLQSGGKLAVSAPAGSNAEGDVDAVTPDVERRVLSKRRTAGTPNSSGKRPRKSLRASMSNNESIEEEVIDEGLGVGKAPPFANGTGNDSEMVDGSIAKNEPEIRSRRDRRRYETPGRNKVNGASTASAQGGASSGRKFSIAELQELVSQADAICSSFFREDGGDPEQALELYTKAANHNYVPGMIGAGRMYETGAMSRGDGTTKVPKSIRLAVEMASKALEKSPNSPAVLNLRGDLWLKTSGAKQKNHKRAREMYNKAAALGDVGALYRKARLLNQQMKNSDSRSTKIRYCQRAMEELTVAVEKGSGEGASLLGSIFENEHEDESVDEVVKNAVGNQDPQKRALELYKMARDLGCPQGMNDLAACYEISYGGLAGNFDSAAALYKMAFENGHLGAACNLGLLYELGGSGTYVDRISYDDAIEWYMIGHSMGCPIATNHLGDLHDNGSILERNPATAEKMYAAAIELARRSNSELDIVDKAYNGLFRMGALSLLMDSVGGDEEQEAFFKRFRKINAQRRVEELRKDFLTIISSGISGTSANSNLELTKSHAIKTIGERNFEEILEVATLCLGHIRSGLNFSQEDVDRLRRIVGQQGMATLGLST